MPESRIRRKAAFTPPAAKSSGPKPNHRLFVPTVVGLLLVGLAWIVTYYLTKSQYPIPNLGNWNLVAGFGILLLGFVMTTRWR
jgi:uncharacterized membrane protein